MPDTLSSSSGSLARTTGVTLVIIVAIAAVDLFLAKMERVEAAGEATRLFNEGQMLSKQGRNSEAIDRLKNALSMERTNRVYRLALADALAAGGRLDEAESHLSDMLRDDPTDAAANLSMARVLTKQSRLDMAISYYHRAIYGKWASNPGQNQVMARFELVDLLAKEGAKQELLAELLPLQDEPEADLRSRRVGQLFLAAGSPAHAAEVFRRILAAHPQDTDAIAGLGETKYARGDCQAAQSDFKAALRLRPNDRHLLDRLHACDEVLELDPIRRGLSAQERYKRSVHLLELTRDRVTKCVPNSASDQMRDLLRDADKATRESIPFSRESEAAESNLDLAFRFWQVGKSDCGQGLASSDEPLALVLAKIGQ